MENSKERNVALPMNAFLWTMIVLLSLEAIGKVCWLARGDIPERKPGVVALDVIACVALLIWAVVLLR